MKETLITNKNPFAPDPKSSGNSEPVGDWEPVRPPEGYPSTPATEDGSDPYGFGSDSPGSSEPVGDWE